MPAADSKLIPPGADARASGKTASIASSAAVAGDFKFADGKTYSFGAALQRRSDADRQASPQPSAMTKLEHEDTELCRACKAKKAKGSAYCPEHKKSQQNLFSFAYRKDKEGKFVNPEAKDAYEAVFGVGRSPPRG